MEQDHAAHDPVSPGIEDGDLVEQSRRAGKESHTLGGGERGLCAQERRVQRIVLCRDLRPGQIQEYTDAQRQDLYQHEEVQSDELPEFPSPELEEILEIRGGVLSLFHALAVAHGIQELESFLVRVHFNIPLL